MLKCLENVLVKHDLLSKTENYWYRISKHLEPWASLCQQVCSPSLNHGLKSMILLTWTDLWTNCTTIILYLNMLQNFNLQPMLIAMNLFMLPNRMHLFYFFHSISHLCIAAKETKRRFMMIRSLKYSIVMWFEFVSQQNGKSHL